MSTSNAQILDFNTILQQKEQGLLGEMHKMRLRHLVAPQSNKVLHTHIQTKMGMCQGGYRSQPKELPMAKAERIGARK